MSQNLTQPEEIDYILMAMAEQDVQAGTPIQDEAQLNGAIYGIERDKAGEVAGFPRRSAA